MSKHRPSILLSRGAKRLYFAMAALLGLFFLCNDLVLPWYVNSGGIVTVPAVIGVNFDAAKRLIDSLGLQAQKGEIGRAHV